MGNIRKIIEYGLYLLVFSLPIQTRLILKSGLVNDGYFEYGTISLYGVDILLVFLLLLFVFWSYKKQKEKPQEEYSFPKVFYLIGGLELFIFISIFFSPDKLVAFYGYVRFLLGVGLFWLVLRANYDRTKLFYSFLTGLFFQAGFGIWQFFVQTSFAFKWLGLAEHNPLVLGTSVVETSEGARWLRAYGGQDHPNVLGGLLMIGILLLFFLAIEKRLKIKKVFFYVFFLFFLAALFFTFSRAAWTGLLIGLISMLTVSVVKKDLFAQKILLKFILLGICLSFILFSQYQNLVLTRLSNETRLEQKSNVERLESFDVFEKIIKGNWLFGVGINSYPLAVKEEISSTQPSWFYQPVHNVYLLIFSEIGIIGLSFFLGLLVYIFWFLQKTLWKEGVYRVGILVSLGVIFMVDHWWWSLHMGVLCFWLTIGILLRVEE